MSTIIRALKKHLQFPSGKKRRGAMSRASERIGVSATTIRRWLNGEWKPGKATCEEIAAMIEDKGMSFEAKKPGPKGPRKRLFSRVNGGK